MFFVHKYCAFFVVHLPHENISTTKSSQSTVSAIVLTGVNLDFVISQQNTWLNYTTSTLTWSFIKTLCVVFGIRHYTFYMALHFLYGITLFIIFQSTYFHPCSGISLLIQGNHLLQGEDVFIGRAKIWSFKERLNLKSKSCTTHNSSRFLVNKFY